MNFMSLWYCVINYECKKLTPVCSLQAQEAANAKDEEMTDADAVKPDAVEEVE
jgi:hypothetical protein